MKFPTSITSLLSDYFRWLAGAVVVIILGLGYWLILGQQLSKIQTTSLAERTKAEQDLKAEQTYLAALRLSIDRFHQTISAETLASIDDFLPSSPDFPGLLLTVKNVAAAANVKLESLKLSQSGQLGETGSAAGSSRTSSTPQANAAAATSLNLKTQDATITVAGGTSYDDFKRFLSVTERSRRLLDVIELSFGISSGQTAAAAYSLTVRTYYLPNTK